MQYKTPHLLQIETETNLLSSLSKPLWYANQMLVKLNNIEGNELNFMVQEAKNMHRNELNIIN